MGKISFNHHKKLKGRNVYNFYERWVGWWDISGVGSHMRKLIRIPIGKLNEFRKVVYNATANFNIVISQPPLHQLFSS